MIIYIAEDADEDRTPLGLSQLIAEITMFEFIGFLVVAAISWSLFKTILSGITKSHKSRSVIHATTLGVPHDFARSMINNHDVLKESMRLMATFDPDYRLKDVYIQHGEAIAMLYQGYLMEREQGH